LKVADYEVIFITSKRVCGQNPKEEFEKNFLKLFKLVGKAKKIKRIGWKKKAKISNGETIAEHMYRLAVLSMIISDLRNLDTEKILRMSLLHDLGEVIIGDLTPDEKNKIGILDTRRLEENGLKQVFNEIPKKLRDYYITLWKEINLQETDEAKLMKSLDKFEMAIQALEYIDEGYDGTKLEHFIDSAKDGLEDKQLLRILKNLK
jgi:5'-deoxynucleotidase YfbR-like HD superfamily hydrolase